MSSSFRFDRTAEDSMERSSANARNGTKLIMILLGILSLVICSVFASKMFSKRNRMQHTIYAEALVVSTIETTTTTTTSTTTTTTTTSTSTTTLTTVTTTEMTTTMATEPVEEYFTEDDFRLPGWDGDVLTSTNGRIQGPSGQETYYNLPMDGIVSWMRRLGFDEETYPYWIRQDGVKMLGDYVMCAANLDLRPRGSFIESSLGMALVCDTGGFAEMNPEQLDIATNWS